MLLSPGHSGLTLPVCLPCERNVRLEEKCRRQDLGWDAFPSLLHCLSPITITCGRWLDD